ncbi:MAG: sugar phosphate nucleotidyltransferase [Candidatus Nanopelagicales bacterium]|nr:sugar phosphate nucleotidyltransferase [Candidatus Nanopelagicales bacterium]MDZ4250029.1 sugar phosphate nucleotidyltransferase [Candidatus Nanopelagicales bacterium]
MKAVLMAGGEGVRMRPLTTTLPKPMLPVVGRPLMAHTIDLLRRHQITDLIVAVYYHAAQIRDYFEDGHDFDVSIRYSNETRPLGTAGSVKASGQALSDGTFLVISGDALTGVDLTAFREFHDRQGADMSLLLAHRGDPREFGVALLDDAERIERLLEKPGWGEVLSDTVNTGIYLVEPHVLDLIPSDRESDWARDVIPDLLRSGAKVAGHVTSGYWEDVGSLASYLTVQSDVLGRLVGAEPPGFQVRPGVWLAEGAEVDPEAKLVAPVFVGPFSKIEKDAVAGPDTVVESNAIVRRTAHVQRSVLFDGCRIDIGVELRGAIIGRDSQLMRGCRVDEGAVIADGCTLEEESVVTRDVLIYPGKTVDAGAVVQDSVVWESTSRKQLFGPHGVSGLVNVELTVDKAVRLAAAFASTLPKGSVVTVGRDHSRAARSFNRAVIGALTAGGLFVRDLRTASVPIVRADTANNSAGGILLRTTPGQPDSLDLLVLGKDGTEADVGKQRAIERAFTRAEFRRPYPRDFGDVRVPHRVAEDYANDLLESVNVVGVTEADLRIVVDTAGGTAALVLPALLGRLGVSVLTVNNRLDESRPTESAAERREALQSLARLVSSSQSAFGVHFDPSGERLSIVDDLGHVIDDDRAALIVSDLALAERQGKVALPIIATRVADEVARFHGSSVLRTPADESDLSRVVASSEVILGADGKGGFIVPGVGPHLDPFAAFVMVLGLVARAKLTLSTIDSRIPVSHVVHADVVTPWARKALVMGTVREHAGAQPQKPVGGVLVDHDARRWVFVRPDSAEAVTHLWAEGESLADAEGLLGQWVNVVKQALT